MKRYVKLGLLVLLVAVLGGAAVKMRETLAVRDAVAAKIRQRPNLAPIRFLYSKNQPIPVYDNRPTVIIVFNPDCEHCQYEAQQLNLHHGAFSRAAVFWLTTDTPAHARVFARQYGLDSLPGVHVGTLTRDEAYRAFGPTSVPHLFVYGADGKLRKEYRGETKIEAITKYL